MNALLQSMATIVGPWRYVLIRSWDDGLPQLVVIMLNPSTADHTVNDPTVLTLIHFAKLWGYGGLRIVNLYAFRSSKPADLVAAGDQASGPSNGKHVTSAVLYAERTSGKVLVAWGNGGGAQAASLTGWLRTRSVELICLGTTLSGSPKHPLARGAHRVPRD